MANRTIENLRKHLNGKIYIYLKDAQTGIRFLQDAENEGYLFGNIKPTKSSGADIIALEKHKQLSYVGFIGHMAFQCPSGVKGGFHRIDYAKYINGDQGFFFNATPNIEELNAIGKFFKKITIVGSNRTEALNYIATNIEHCENENDEIKLYNYVEERFDVFIHYEE